MTTIQTVFLFLVLLKTCAAGSKKTLPVLMIDHDSVMSRLTIESNPFEVTRSPFFTDLALEAVKRTSCLVIFVEDQLCTEDISSKDDLGTPFYNLRNGIPDKTVVYFPAVTEPYNLLLQIFEPQDTNVFRLRSKEKLAIPDMDRYIYVYFDDSEINRIETLRKHDMLMQEVYFIVRQKKQGPVLAFYTGKRNPITVAQLRHSPLAELQPSRERGVVVTTPDAIFRLTGVSSSTSYRRSIFEDTPVVEYEMRTRRSLSTTMLITDYHLQFNFEFDEKNWKLANVALLEAGEEVGRTQTFIEAPWRTSYYCAEPITIFNLRDGSSITIAEYQVEPLHESRRFDCGDRAVFRANDTGRQRSSGTCDFSPASNCGPYFNAAILSGLIVFLLFTVITFWGVVMLFDCKCCSSYDDPNQKPLVIAQEAGGGGL